MRENRALPGELKVLRQFRARIIAAFARGDLFCNCRGITHEDACPLGPLEHWWVQEARNQEALSEQQRKAGGGDA